MRVRAAADLADRVVLGVRRSELAVVFVQDQSGRVRGLGRISRPEPGRNLGDPGMAFLTQPCVVSSRTDLSCRCAATEARSMPDTRVSFTPVDNHTNHAIQSERRAAH